MIKVKMKSKMQIAVDGITVRLVEDGQMVDLPDGMAFAFIKQGVAEPIKEGKAFDRAPEIPEDSLSERERKRTRKGGKRLKVYELSRELNITVLELIAKATELEINLTGAQSFVEDDDAHRIRMVLLGDV